MQQRKRFRWAAVLLGVLAAVTTAPVFGALIQPDVASPSSIASNSYRAEFTIDGSGLPTGFTPASVHAAYTTGNHWTTDGTNPLAESILWGFNTAQTLNTIYIWNHQSTAGHAANTGYDVTLYDLTLLDGSGTTIASFNDVALAPDTATGQTFFFGGSYSGIRAVRFAVEGVQSSPTYTGLAEVAFANVAAVPEPSTYALMIGGLGLVAFVAHRRRKTHGAVPV